MDVQPLANVQPEQIEDALTNGKTIVYPTETCYGLGCDASNQDAVDAIFAIKKRQKDKPLLVLMPDQDMAMEYVEWGPELDRLSVLHWPGPLTVVAPLKEGHEPIAEGIAGPDGTLAFRITDHPIAYELSASLAKPLVSTSANIAAQESPYSIADVLSMFKDEAIQPDIVIDAGELPHKSPSTVVRIVNGSVEVLRQGEIVLDPESLA